jgi:hypothetical protein
MSDVEGEQTDVSLLSAAEVQANARDVMTQGEEPG